MNTNRHEVKITDREKTYGGGYRGVRVITTLRKLRDEFGSESFPKSDDGKVTHEWAFEIKPDSILTIYDWKEGKLIGLDDEIEWHIGGKHVTEAEIVEFLCANCFTGDYQID